MPLPIPTIWKKELELKTDVTKTRNGEWGMGNGEWGMGNGEWGMGNSGQR